MRSALPAIAGAVLVALALPTLSLHTTQTGIEGFTTPAVEPFSRLIDAFPGTPDPAVVAIKADHLNTQEVPDAVAELGLGQEQEVVHAPTVDGHRGDDAALRREKKRIARLVQSQRLDVVGQHPLEEVLGVGARDPNVVARPRGHSARNGCHAQ